MKWSKEFVRYAVVGAAMNVFGFLLYVLFTTLGVSPVLTISIFYPIHVGLAFYLNKKWSFRHKGRISTSAIRYLIAYVGCYVLNVTVLKFFSGYLGYSHLVVQAIAILVIALLLFWYKSTGFSKLGASQLLTCSPYEAMSPLLPSI